MFVCVLVLVVVRKCQIPVCVASGQSVRTRTHFTFRTTSPTVVLAWAWLDKCENNENRLFTLD